MKKSVALVHNNSGNGVAREQSSGLTAVPKIEDVVGSALSKIGTYNDLDNKKQVVALIDDVRFGSSTISKFFKRFFCFRIFVSTVVNVI